MTLLCLHGFTGSPKSFDFLPPQLARVTPALVGHSGSTASDAITRFEQEVDRLAALASEPMHVVGYSLGARLALGLAVRHPERVTRLTLVSAHPGLATDALRTARRASDAAWCELLQTRGIAAFVEAWAEAPLWTSQRRLGSAVRALKKQERLTQTAAGLARSLRVTGLAEMPNYAPALGNIRVPTDVLAGELDLKFCDLARFLAKNISHARLEIAPAVGHDLLLERPDFITEVIRRGSET